MKRLASSRSVSGRRVHAPAQPRSSRRSRRRRPAATAHAEQADEGIPVTSDSCRQKCSGCHRADDKGRMTRISYRRTTPEGWEETIKRMVHAEQREARAGRRARDPPLSCRPSRPGARGSAGRRAFEVERRDDRLQIHRRQGHRRNVHRLPLDRPRDLPAPHEERVGAARSRCTAATTRSSDFQAFRRTGPAAATARARRPAARQPASDGRRRSPTCRRHFR